MVNFVMVMLMAMTMGWWWRWNWWVIVKTLSWRCPPLSSNALHGPPHEWVALQDGVEVVDVEGEHVAVSFRSYACNPSDEQNGADANQADDVDDADDANGTDDAYDLPHLVLVSRQISPKYDPSLNDVATFEWERNCFENVPRCPITINMIWTSPVPITMSTIPSCMKYIFVPTQPSFIITSPKKGIFIRDPEILFSFIIISP